MTQLPILEQSKSTSAQRSTGQASSKGTYAFVSLGCPKNTVDSERMLGLLRLDGYELVFEPQGTDFVVVNTCGFIERARTESFSAIDEMLALKASGGTRGVIVTGCLAERQKEDLLKDRPEIDQLVGVFGREEITRVADRLVGRLQEQRTIFQPAPIRPLPDSDRLRITPRHFAYLKISEGCDRLCTFCAIPKMRGKHYSKPMDEVVAEARQLAADGVKELIIVAQDTTYYGIDLHGEPKLAELLTRLENEVEVDWIRLMYFYPMYVTDELLDVMARSRRIVPYVDIPLQHINDHMLRRMSRRVTRSETETLLARMRGAIPDLSLRTTFIVGFPGESEEQYAELEAFVREQKFQRMGAFTYSFEPDTPAALLPDQIPAEIMEDRQARLMLAQREVSAELCASKVGKVLPVIIDRAMPDQKNVWVGRTIADAPDVDGLVFVTANRKMKITPGKIIRTEIVAHQDYDLIAHAVETE